MEPVEGVSKFFPDLVLTCVATWGPNGKHRVYSDMIEALAYTMRQRLANHHQNVICIEGGTGSGKSTLAIQLCRALKRDWSVADNYIYGLDDLKRKLDKQETDCIHLFDEGSVILNSFNSQRAEDKQISVLFDTMRSLRWTTIICIPSFTSLNKRIRENHVDFRLSCPDKAPLPNYASRGFFHAYKRKKSQFARGVYWMPIGTGIFTPLKPRIDKEYQEIKRKSQNRLIRAFIDEE